MYNWLSQIEAQWYGKTTWLRCLVPFEKLFIVVITARRFAYDCFAYKSKIPVWVIGNISVGGNGKTPFVIDIARRIQAQGYCVRVIAHGYGAQLTQPVNICMPDSDPNRYGDEAALLAQELDMPVVVAKKRAQAVRYIEAHYPDTDVILCDDGLQHYQLKRDKEVVLVDKQRLGNKRCLPVGPLREPIARLRQADLCLYREDNIGSDIYYELVHFVHMQSQQIVVLAALPFKRVHAVAGIAYPEGFFQSLERLGLEVIRHTFPDHHSFDAQDCVFNDDLPVLMTTKDAIKCQSFARENWYIVAAALRLSAPAASSVNDLILTLAAR